MTDRLTLAHIESHQDLKGARKYPTTLADAGLSVGALLLHGLEEEVDRRRYFTLAGIWTPADEERHADLVARALPLADHPKPLPPDVPTVEAVGSGFAWWQYGEDVVQVEFGENGIGRFWQVGDRYTYGIDPTDTRWLGPVPMRAVRS